MAKKSPAFVVGGVPRVNLLPQDARAQSELKALQRGIVYAMLLILLASGGAWYYTWTQAEQAEAALKAEQAKTDALLAAKKEFSEIPDILNALDTGKRALQAVDEHAVDWAPLLSSILNAGGSIEVTDLTVNGNSVASENATTSGHYLTTKTGTVHIAITVHARDAQRLTEWAEAVKQIAGFGEYWTGKFTVRDADKTVGATYDLYFDNTALRRVQRQALEQYLPSDDKGEAKEEAK